METLKAAYFSAGKRNPTRGSRDPHGVSAGERTSGAEGALQVIALPFWRSIYRSHPSSHSKNIFFTLLRYTDGYSSPNLFPSPLPKLHLVQFFLYLSSFFNSLYLPPYRIFP
jgi:hypothetical protein